MYRLLFSCRHIHELHTSKNGRFWPTLYSYLYNTVCVPRDTLHSQPEPCARKARNEPRDQPTAQRNALPTAITLARCCRSGILVLHIVLVLNQPYAIYIMCTNVFNKFKILANVNVR